MIKLNEKKYSKKFYGSRRLVEVDKSEESLPQATIPKTDHNGNDFSNVRGSVKEDYYVSAFDQSKRSSFHGSQNSWNHLRHVRGIRQRIRGVELKERTKVVDLGDRNTSLEEGRKG